MFYTIECKLDCFYICHGPGLLVLVSMAREKAEYHFDISKLPFLFGLYHAEPVTGKRDSKYTPNPAPSRKVSQQEQTQALATSD